MRKDNLIKKGKKRSVVSTSVKKIDKKKKEDMCNAGDESVPTGVTDMFYCKFDTKRNSSDK